MKKKKLINPLLSILCIALLIGIVSTVISYNNLIKSSNRPVDIDYNYQLALSEKFDSFTAFGVKYVRLENTDKVSDSTKFSDEIGRVSDFDPSFKKYAYSINGIVCSSINDENILRVAFTNGAVYYFVPENMIKQYS